MTQIRAHFRLALEVGRESSVRFVTYSPGSRLADIGYDSDLALTV